MEIEDVKKCMSISAAKDYTRVSLPIEAVDELIDKINQLQAELLTAKQEGDTMWEGLNGR